MNRTDSSHPIELGIALGLGLARLLRPLLVALVALGLLLAGSRPQTGPVINSTVDTSVEALEQIRGISARIEAAIQPCGARFDSVAVAVDTAALQTAADEALGLMERVELQWPHLRKYSAQLAAAAHRAQGLLLGEDGDDRDDAAPGWAAGRRQPVLVVSPWATGVVRHDAAQAPAQPAEPQWRPLMQGNRERAGIVTDGRGGWRRVG